ncbi:hypothetical protein AMJ80_05495 [bacterium SM23_31]|nr:MAG: hypothetical protein AMJ80_05495 [bacterium SM23_31]
MRKIYSCLLLTTFIFLGSGAAAQDLNLNNYGAATFSNLTKAAGQILGSGLYHTAAIHRFGGVDLGLKSMLGYIPKKNQLGPLDGTKAVIIPVFQANVGLFGRFEVGGRLFSFRFGDENKEKVELTSGLVKFSVLRGIGLPDVTIFSAYSRITGISDFSLSAITVGGIVGKSIPVITVYAGANYNIIKMDVDLAPDAHYPEGFSESYKENVPHFAFGISLGLTPFTKMNVEYNIGEFQTATFGIVLSIF